MPGFTVDTHLFSELGALLVGRDSTALNELVKNAYDADASTVTVHGEGLETLPADQSQVDRRRRRDDCGSIRATDSFGSPRA